MFGESLTSHFWVASTPLFQTALFFVPDGTRFQAGMEELSSEQKSYTTDIKIFDADGELINEVATTYPIDRVGILEIEPLLEVCKYEGGMKHGRAVITCSAPAQPMSRIQGRDSAVFMGELLPLNTQQRAFIPVTLSEGKSSILILSNFSASPSSIKCKLIVGKRSPETQVDVPAGGTRMLSLESEFPEYADLTVSRAVQGYLRLSTRSDDQIGVQLFERLEGAKESSLFTTIG
ncbi:MAG: hypothetical protein J5J00_15715 [Deltaproteobacteria bacterium]|nr:hypothetical protein [Deltaproteobacteria bacterium]